MLSPASSRTLVNAKLGVLMKAHYILPLVALLAFPAVAQNAPTPAKTGIVASELLPNVPGKRVTVVRVQYEPGGKTEAHRHAGSVLALVIEGEIRSENSATGPARVYKAGESFFEPPDSAHLVSENASKTKPATLLAIFVADDGAELTMMGAK